MLPTTRGIQQEEAQPAQRCDLLETFGQQLTFAPLEKDPLTNRLRGSQEEVDSRRKLTCLSRP